MDVVAAAFDTIVVDMEQGVLGFDVSDSCAPP